MKKIIFGVLLFLPSFVFANVRINEIAWMGTVNSSSDEWIELYNDGDSSVDITNWTLSISTKKLSGTIPAKGYYFLERTDDTTVPTVTADFIYTGALSDTGVRLILQNESGAEVDTIDASEGWKKGDKDTKETMQWNGTVWITAGATPRAENKTVDTTVDETVADTETDTSDANSSHSSALDTSAHVSPLPLSDFSQKQELYISAGRNRIVAVGSPVFFEAFAVSAKGVKSQNITSIWSFGDGTQAGGAKVTHTYKYPGDYVVVLNANTSGNEAVSRAEVKVFAPKIILATESDGSVSLQNDSAYEINIGGWKIVASGRTFTASSDTIIKAGKKLIFPKAITGIDFSADVSVNLLSPDSIIVASFIKSKPIALFATTTPMEISLGGGTPKLKNTEAVDEVAKIDAPLIVVPKSKPQTQTASAVLAVPEKVQETKTSAPAGEVKQTITLKKPEGFLTKIWNFFF